jgi:hypothetical protein
MSSGYAVASQAKNPRRPPRITSSNQIKRARYTVEDKPMKLTIKQKFRNWLMNDTNTIGELEQDHYVETDRFSSDGMRFNLYKASGGFVIETRSYDRRKDENVNSMYVITEDKDLGEELGKIITMESLR